MGNSKGILGGAIALLAVSFIVFIVMQDKLVGFLFLIAAILMMIAYNIKRKKEQQANNQDNSKKD